MMETDYTQLEVEQLLPHSGDMVLLDKLLDYGDDYAVAYCRVKTTDKFYQAERQGIHCMIGLEWMAQTIAAVAGIKALQQGQPVQVGFLLGTRKYEPSKSVFRLGEEFTVAVKQLYREDNGLGAFECSIQQQHELIAQAKLNVFAPDDVTKYLKGEGV